MTFLECLEKSIDRYFACVPRWRPQKQLLQEVYLIAHRGAHSKKLRIIENTLPAFDRALKLGCWGVELDIQMTADQVPVVHHDPDLNRLWGKNQWVNQLSFSELKKEVPMIPSLEEVINRYGNSLHFFIELKAPFAGEDALFEVLSSLQSETDYHLLSLDEEIFRELTLFSRQAMLLVAGHNNMARFCQDSLAQQYGGVLGHYLLFSSKKIELLKLAEQKVGVGFVDSKNVLYREVHRGMRWIFSNNVGAISRMLNEPRD
ncbi:glycerophosphodiester phosphodiesterase [Legionella quinlivanii]|uniref:glycerophosphodiester phosphodiesterase n=1 Tax=Legionella quinlivanii TaxID=45073 RepID=UPI00224420E2|nr:glycerophosphodiester phosphodiesterase [Legionella quinlivanii]MCW8452282.1 glycerophosphodiester phosphodiesterase [Legionella quinlivanii]